MQCSLSEVGGVVVVALGLGLAHGVALCDEEEVHRRAP